MRDIHKSILTGVCWTAGFGLCIVALAVLISWGNDEAECRKTCFPFKVLHCTVSMGDGREGVVCASEKGPIVKPLDHYVDVVTP